MDCDKLSEKIHHLEDRERVMPPMKKKGGFRIEAPKLSVSVICIVKMFPGGQNDELHLPNFCGLFQ